MLAVVEQKEKVTGDEWRVAQPCLLPAPPSPGIMGAITLETLLSAISPGGLAVLRLKVDSWTLVRTFWDPLWVSGARWKRLV